MESPAMANVSTEILETFENPFPQRNYLIEIVCPEFTSLCPKTGQPDFGTLTFTYCPNDHCVELKSLKMYLQQFRDQGIFYENITNSIVNDIVRVIEPKHLKCEAAFSARGGITTKVTVEYPSADGEKVD